MYYYYRTWYKAKYLYCHGGNPSYTFMILYIKTVLLKIDAFWKGILFSISLIIVSVISYSHIWNKVQKRVWQHIRKNVFRSSHQKCSMKKGVLINFAKFTGKHMCQSLFFRKVAGLRLRHRCFPVNFCEIFKSIFLREHLWMIESGFLK